MNKALTSLVAGAAAFAVGSRWIKMRRSRGLSDPVTTVKITANRVKERVHPGSDPAPEPTTEDSADTEEAGDSEQEPVGAASP